MLRSPCGQALVLDSPACLLEIHTVTRSLSVLTMTYPPRYPYNVSSGQNSACRWLEGPLSSKGLSLILYSTVFIGLRSTNLRNNFHPLSSQGFPSFGQSNSVEIPSPKPQDSGFFPTGPSYASAISWSSVTYGGDPEEYAWLVFDSVWVFSTWLESVSL